VSLPPNPDDPRPVTPPPDDDAATPEQPAPSPATPEQPPTAPQADVPPGQPQAVPPLEVSPGQPVTSSQPPVPPITQPEAPRPNPPTQPQAPSYPVTQPQPQVPSYPPTQPHPQTASMPALSYPATQPQGQVPPSGGWAAPPSGGWGPPPGAPPGTGHPGSSHGVPPVWGPPPPGARKAPNRMALIAVVSVLAVAAAGFAAVNISSGGQAGASSPDAAVQEFFDAVGNEDLIGVLGEVAPAERDVMVTWFEGLESNLSELGIIDDVDLDSIGGVDLEVEGLEAQSEEVMPGVSKVTVTGGQLSFRTEPDSVPVGDVLENLIEANGGEVDIEQTSDQVDFAEEAQDEYSDPLFLVATEQDGRWYLSLSYTIAEYARLDSGEDVPDPGAGVAPQGAPTAEDAVRDFLTAAVDLDVERLISLLPPDQMGALQTYAPLFLDDAEESVAELRDEEGYEGTVEGLEFETSGVDGGTRVVPTAGTATFSFYDGDMSLTMEDGDLCVEVTGDMATDMEDEWGTSVVCQGDLGDLGGELSDDERQELEELGALFTDYQAGVVVVERDGAFYVDPLRTFSDLTLQVFQGIERDHLEEGGILYRIFTGESFLFPEVEEDYDDYDVDFEDEEPAGSGESEGSSSSGEAEEPGGSGEGSDEGGNGAPSSESESYREGFDEGYASGLSEGTVHGAAGEDYTLDYDTAAETAAAAAAGATVDDPLDFEYGYLDGYLEGYDEGYYSS
jgi:hypothetical protein